MFKELNMWKSHDMVIFKCLKDAWMWIRRKSHRIKGTLDGTSQFLGLIPVIETDPSCSVYRDGGQTLRPQEPWVQSRAWSEPGPGFRGSGGPWTAIPLPPRASFPWKSEVNVLILLLIATVSTADFTGIHPPSSALCPVSLSLCLSSLHPYTESRVFFATGMTFCGSNFHIGGWRGRGTGERMTS